MVEQKKYEDMSSLELKGVLFDMDNQIKRIQQEANSKIVPLLEKKVKEEQEKQTLSKKE
jgi:hypothetical protein